MEICNNHMHDALNSFRRRFHLRGRKTACRKKPAKGIQIKKPIDNKKKRKLEAHCQGDDHRPKKRRIYASVDDYESLGKISQGSFGAVYKVRENRSGEIFAIKEDLDPSCPTTLSEIEMLESLGDHPSIVGLRKVALDDGLDVYMVMEFVENDLRGYINLNKEEGLQITQVKSLMKQLLEGVKFLHQNKVMHRDLKTSNVLVNAEGELKICDFGLAIRFEEGEMYESDVGTLVYRAPEMLEGARMYSGEVDMWAVGCIMAELVLKKPLFEGIREYDQLLDINRMLGPPEWDDEEDDKPLCSLREVLASADLKLTDAGFDLLSRFLSYDPSKRITAQDALDHAWFQEN